MFLAFCGPVGQDAGAQATVPPTASTPKATISAADLFSKDLEILSKRFGVAFVAEGQPFPMPSSEPAPTLSAKLSQADAIQEVADYFDYSAIRQGKAYLLTKRYTNPEDLPDVTPEECQFGLKSILTIVTPFNPHFPSNTGAGDPRAQIAHMLSPEQLERLGKDGVPVSELTQAEHEEVWKLALYSYIQWRATAIEQAVAQFENRNPADPVFYHRNLLKTDVFGYDMRSSALNKMVFVQLSDTHRIVIHSDGKAVAQDPGFRSVDGVTTPSPDPTDPSVLSDPMKLFLDDKARSTHVGSLSGAISALNGRSVNHVVYKVDPMYAMKHVTLTGADKLSEGALMHALANVYGLRVVEQEDRSIILTHPAVHEAKRISDVARAIRGAIPDPIFRVLRLTTVDEQTRRGGPGRPIPWTPHGYARATSAMRIFRYLAESQVKSSNAGRAALSQLDVRARHMFEFAPTARLYADVCEIADTSVPLYFTDFDHAILTGGIYINSEGNNRFSFYVDALDPKTGVKEGFGYTNATVPP